MNPGRVRPLVLAATALFFALALVGCGPRSATPASKPRIQGTQSEVGIPRNAAGQIDFEAARKRVDEMQAALDRMPFEAATTIAFPASLPGMGGLDVSPVPPTVASTLVDRYEPDAKAAATILPIETSQVHTLDSAKDVDWFRVPNTQGKGYLVVVASAGVHVVSDAMDASESGPGPVVLWMPNDADRRETGSMSVRVESDEAPISYRIAHVRLMPSSQIGQETPQIAAESFLSALEGPSPGEYWEATGDRVATSTLRVMRAQIFGATDTDTGAEEYAVTRSEDAATQRWIMRYGEGTAPIAVWARSQKRHGRWFVVAAGIDGSATSAQVRAYTSFVDNSLGQMTAGKPAIYLYPPTAEQVTVRLELAGTVTTSAPAIDPAIGGWTVTARPDGKITDAVGREWPYLFWEGRVRPRFDMSTGAVVAGPDSKAFLTRSLADLGLNAAERAAFIEFWLPRLQDSPYNLIHFEGPAYERIARLDIRPKPDTVIRVFMAYRPLEVPVPVRPQLLTAPERRGFTVVEWGGGLDRR